MFYGLAAVASIWAAMVAAACMAANEPINDEVL